MTDLSNIEDFAERCHGWQARVQKIKTQEWLEGILAKFYVAIHQHVADNIDPRFAGDVGNESFLVDYHAKYAALLALRVEEFYESRCLLSDQASKDTFDKVVLFRLLSHFHFRIAEASEVDWRNKTDHRETVVEGVIVPRVIPFGDGRAYEIAAGGFGLRPYRAIGTEGMLGNAFFGGQYEYGDVRVRPGDVVMDGGAYFGDTALPFADQVGAKGKVFAFEPSRDSLVILQENIHMNALEDRVTVMPFGLGDEDCEEGVLLDGALPWARIGVDTRMFRLDSLVRNGVVPEKVDFIKLDVEGSELRALLGAVETLNRCRPRLAICVYHCPQDLFTIPLFLGSMLADYRWYLKHHSIRVDETVFYGEPQ